MLLISSNGQYCNKVLDCQRECIAGFLQSPDSQSAVFEVYIDSLRPARATWSTQLFKQHYMHSYG